MASLQRITPCLWFADQGEEAARFYTGIFPNSRITAITRYGTAGFETHGRPAGSVMTVEFELDGHTFTALNGGPLFTFNEAVSLQVNCVTQEEIDYYWEKLGDGGDPSAQVCGWLKDRYGLSWQVVPTIMGEWMKDAESPGTQRAFTAMLQMKKLDIAERTTARRKPRAQHSSETPRATTRDVILSGAAAPNSRSPRSPAAPEGSVACLRARRRLSLGRRL
jgi:predicted 3-demethylubiquinone-9 3-methyltransferase (glyoxalase superfamily)